MKASNTQPVSKNAHPAFAFINPPGPVEESLTGISSGYSYLVECRQKTIQKRLVREWILT
jgi:hypothetical protein